MLEPVTKLTLGCLLYLCVCAPASAAPNDRPSDWKLYGGVTLPDNEGSIKCFYDAKNIHVNADGNKTVWTKCLSDKAMELSKLTKEQKAQVTQETDQELSRGNVPPFVKGLQIDKGTIWGVLYMEAQANNDFVMPKAKNETEIDCEKKLSRNLTSSWFKNGNYDTNWKPEDWSAIKPESLGGQLMPIVCN